MGKIRKISDIKREKSRPGEEYQYIVMLDRRNFTYLGFLCHWSHDNKFFCRPTSQWLGPFANFNAMEMEISNNV